MRDRVIGRLVGVVSVSYMVSFLVRVCDTMSALSLPFWTKAIRNVLVFCHFMSLHRHLLFPSVFFVVVIFHIRTQIKHEKQMFGFSILNIYAYIRLIKFYSTATGHNDLFIDITTISLYEDCSMQFTWSHNKLKSVICTDTQTSTHAQRTVKYGRLMLFSFSFLFFSFWSFLFLAFFCIFYFIVNVEVAPDAFLFSSISLTALA